MKGLCFLHEPRQPAEQRKAESLSAVEIIERFLRP